MPVLLECKKQHWFLFTRNNSQTFFSSTSGSITEKGILQQMVQMQSLLFRNVSSKASGSTVQHCFISHDGLHNNWPAFWNQPRLFVLYRFNFDELDVWELWTTHLIKAWHCCKNLKWLQALNKVLTHFFVFLERSFHRTRYEMSYLQAPKLIESKKYWVEELIF